MPSGQMPFCHSLCPLLTGTGTRVVQILHDSADPKCDGDGCGEESSDYVE